MRMKTTGRSQVGRADIVGGPPNPVNSIAECALILVAVILILGLVLNSKAFIGVAAFILAWGIGLFVGVGLPIMAAMSFMEKKTKMSNEWKNR